VPDLKVLQGMSLESLSIWGCVGVQDLSPLHGMPLTVLNLPECRQVKDLGPLKGMRLKRLEIVDTGVTDLKPLQGMSLESISLTPKIINQSLEILRYMKSLKTIQIGRLDEGLPAAEFWTLYDKGEFKK
jgi:hypothetical protein